VGEPGRSRSASLPQPSIIFRTRSEFAARLNISEALADNTTSRSLFLRGPQLVEHGRPLIIDAGKFKRRIVGSRWQASEAVGRRRKAVEMALEDTGYGSAEMLAWLVDERRSEHIGAPRTRPTFTGSRSNQAFSKVIDEPQ
jgi:hypothetical protein